MIPPDVLEDRNQDGVIDYLNARIYVADFPAPDELAAAANIAARLAFETLSMDLPVGFPISAYRAADTTIAIIVGAAALRFADVSLDGGRRVIAIPLAADAERFAHTFGHELESQPDGEHKRVQPTREKSFSLATLFTIDGLFGDSAGGFIPDRLETQIILGPDVHSIPVIDLAARIALEAAGLRLPLVIVASDETPPQNAILIGKSNPHVAALIQSSRFHPELRAGHGRIQVVHKAFAEHTAIVIAGADSAGESEAIIHAALRLPYVWQYGKEYLHLSTIEEDARRFFEFRSPAGQMAAALARARQAERSLKDGNLVVTELEVLGNYNGDDGDDGDGGQPFADYFVKQFPGLLVNAASLAHEAAQTVFDETYSIVWEGQVAKKRITEAVVPRIRAGARVKIELRLSESLPIRLQLTTEIRQLMEQSGADPNQIQVRVLSAHKQGYCWIDEELKPQLKGASRIEIHFQEIEPGTHTIESPLRWLHELYPIDEVLARDLDIPVENVSFHKTAPNTGPVYQVHAEGSDGKIVLHASFDPKFVMQPMFDLYPDYATVRVATGWLHATVDGSIAANERIETDPEKFWSEFQAKTLAKIHNYIGHLYRETPDPPPNPSPGPHFGTLEVDLWLSEPDYRIGIDEERISTLEALHEDIYFETLLFFELHGLTNPGRIIPRIHPARDGQDGTARIRFTGKPGPHPRIILKWTDPAGQSGHQTIDLLPVSTARPEILAAVVRSGHAGVVSLEIGSLPELNSASAMVEAVRELHDQAIGLSWLSYDSVDSLLLGSHEIPQTDGPYRQPQIQLATRTATPIVQWDSPIGPDECERAIRSLAAYREVRPFHAGRSVLGRNIWAMDVLAPMDGKYISQAKLSVAKPVLYITGRQHANEVSSTSHILKLAEMLATDPVCRELLKRVNFVLQPIVNPDGAALVEEIHRDTPDFMCHAGYFGAFGMDVTQEQWAQDPQYPEARVRPSLWRMWLPDIVLNPHGYPSHEWVQLFAGYTAWVRTRDRTARDWWIPRGWFIPHFEFMEDSRETAFEIRSRVDAAIHKAIGPLNERMVRRYTKYDLRIDALPKSLNPDPHAFTFMQRYPQVTLLEIVSETPDEAAHGEWLKQMARAGLEFSLVHARFLAASKYVVKRTIQQNPNETVLRLSRRRQ